MGTRNLRISIGGIAIAVAMLAGASGAAAATINVTTTIDEFGSGNRCSLREALWSANNDDVTMAVGCRAGSGKDKVVVPSGQFNLERRNVAPEVIEGEEPLPVPKVEDLGVTGDLDVTAPVSIVHGGTNLATIQNKMGNERLFHVLSDGVVLQGLTISGGRANGEVNDHGGGILNEGGLTVRSSTISGNRAIYGGGISTAGTSTALIVNSTVTGNEASEDGGGISVETAGTIAIRSSTVTNNEADRDGSGGGDGGGIFASTSADGGILELKNALIAGNRDTGSEASDCAKLGGTITSQGHNLISNANGCDFVAAAGDIINRQGMLLRLNYNGGPTWTSALKTISPAVNKGAGCPPKDQRGVARTGKCDIGAWELSYCQGAVINRIGTESADLLSGTSGRDGILGLGGQDTLRGLGGNDGLCGGNGPDVLEGGPGRDKMDGGSGKDNCLGANARDTLVKCELPKVKQPKKKGNKGRR